MLSLRTLNALVAVAEEASFSKAADRLHITQPALSRCVAKLEADCGLALFERGRNGVRPTAAGIDLLSKTRRLLAEAASIEQDLILQSRGEAGRVAIGMGPLASSVLMSRLLKETIARWPLLSIVTTVAPTQALIDRVLDGEIDFCICSRNTLAPNTLLAVTQVTQLRMGYFVRAGHPLLKVAPGQRAAEFLHYPRVTGSFPVSPHWHHRTVFNDVGPTLECDDFGVLKQLTLETDAIWLTSSKALTAETGDGRIVELPAEPDQQAITADLVMVRLRARTFLPAALRVMELVGSDII